MHDEHVAAWCRTRDHAKPDGRTRELFERQADRLADARDYGAPTDPRVRALQIARRTRNADAVRRAKPLPVRDDTARARFNEAMGHARRVREALARIRNNIKGLASVSASPAARVEIAGMLPYYPRQAVAPVERLEPLPRVAGQLWAQLAQLHGPLTRRQQAEAAFTFAIYGDVQYVGLEA